MFTTRTYKITDDSFVNDITNLWNQMNTTTTTKNDSNLQIVTSKDNKTKYYRVNVPGFNREDIDISERNNVIYISASCNDETFGEQKFNTNFAKPDGFVLSSAKYNLGTITFTFALQQTGNKIDLI